MNASLLPANRVPTGVLTFDQPLSDEQLHAIKEAVEKLLAAGIDLRGMRFLPITTENVVLTHTERYG